MQIEARYGSVPELAADVASQLGRGGLLVRGEVPPGLEQFAAVELTVRCGGSSVVVPAQVLSLFPGVGVAVAIAAPERARIAALADAPAAAPAEDGPAPSADAETLGPESVAPAARATPGPAAPMLDKIQRALKGDRDQRFQIMRDTNRQLHMHLLRNPAIGLDEIAMMARMPGVSVDALRAIATRREWGHRPEIAIALVRNPTVPVPLACELIAHVSDADLKQLAKDTRTREPVQRAARRRLIK